MGRPKKQSIEININVLHDLLWMSMRYCIGRHTIAAASLPNDLYSIFKNKKMENHCKWFADNIRSELNRLLHFYLQFDVSYNYNHYNNDAFSILFDFIIKNFPDGVEESYFIKNQFNIDVNTNNITITPNTNDNKSSVSNPSHDFHDIFPWIKLANYLDTSKHYHVNINNEDMDVFPYYGIQYVNEHTIKIKKYYIDTTHASQLYNIYLDPAIIDKIIEK